MLFIEDLKSRITQFMKTYGMSKTMLGTNALNDAHAIPRWLEHNSDPKLSSIQRLYDYMDKYAAERAPRPKKK